MVDPIFDLVNSNFSHRSGGVLIDEKSKGTYAFVLSCTDPKDGNILNETRLGELLKLIKTCLRTGSNLLIAAYAGGERKLNDDGCPKDDRTFSQGLCLPGNNPSTSHMNLYNRVVNNMKILSCKRTVIAMINGAMDASLFSLLNACSFNIVSEYAFIDYGLSDSAHDTADVIHGLDMVSKIKDGGIALYLLLHPKHRYRGKDLYTFGLADCFIPEARFGYLGSRIRNFGHHLGENQFQQLLENEKVYPGPSSIEVWKTEIEKCFEVGLFYLK